MRPRKAIPNISYFIIIIVCKVGLMSKLENVGGNF